MFKINKLFCCCDKIIKHTLEESFNSFEEAAAYLNIALACKSASLLEDVHWHTGKTSLKIESSEKGGYVIKIFIDDNYCYQDIYRIVKVEDKNMTAKEVRNYMKECEDQEFKTYLGFIIEDIDKRILKCAKQGETEITELITNALYLKPVMEHYTKEGFKVVVEFGNINHHDRLIISW